MKNSINFEKLNIYFIGIGGISMSGLCKLSQHFGAKVSGSDTGDNPEIDKLKEMGIKVNNKHLADNITEDIHLVVYTSAISIDNPELQRAQELEIKTMERAEFLGVISNMYNNVIAVSGTHGKTTTTAMIAEILTSASLNPTVHLGGESIGLAGNTIVGDDNYLVVEACEYKESFRYLKPNIAVITNIELDHVDYYRDYDDIHSAFQRFADNCSQLIMPGNCGIDHQSCEKLFSDWCIKSLEFIGGGYNFNVYHLGRFYESFRINMLGYHNVINALNAIIVSHKLGIKKEVIVYALASFQGVERRYETIKVFDSDCRLVIDYAHHPTEIENSVKGIQDVYKNVLFVFQPHTYSRTLELFNDFVEVLNALDDVVLYTTYPAREDCIIGGRAEDLYNAIESNNKCFFDNINSLVEYIEAESFRYDCILILGAGDLADKLKRNYRNIGIIAKSLDK